MAAVQRRAVADLDSLAVSRFRSALLNSSITHRPKSHHVFTYTLFRGGGGQIASQPGQKLEILNVVQKAGELSKWMHDIMVAEDMDTQRSIFAKISARMTMFSFHLDDLAFMCGYDTKTGTATYTTAYYAPLANTGQPNLLQPVPKGTAGAIAVQEPWTSAGLATSPGKEGPVLYSLGACLKPIFDTITSSEATLQSSSSAGSGSPTTLGSTLRMLCSQNCDIQPEQSFGKLYGGSVPSDILQNVEMQLGSSLGSLADPGSGTMQDLLSAYKNKAGPMWNNIGISGFLSTSTSPDMKTLLGCMAGIESDVGDLVSAVQGIEQVVAEVEQIWDIIATYLPVVLGILALL